MPPQLQLRPKPALAFRLAPRLVVLAAITIGAVWGYGALTGRERALDAAELQARTAALAAAGQIALQPVDAAERSAALATMKLAPAQQAQFDRDRPDLVWLTLWDHWDEDGDVVAVESDGFSQQVRIAHQPARIAVPRPQGGIITLRGVTDGGGGGITVAIARPSGRLDLPPLQPGAVLRLPVR